MRPLLGVLVGLVARLWLATLRLRVVAHPLLGPVAGRPWVLVFFHGTQWPLLAWRRRRPTLVMVSWSADGSLQSLALRMLGFTVVRGSSSKGGARALASLVRALRPGARDAAFAVDGPRGPYGVAKGGARTAARSAGAVLVPMGAAVERGVCLSRAWDRFVIAWPWSRVVVHLGAPVEPGAPRGDVDVELSERIADANDAAAGEARSLWGARDRLATWPAQLGGAREVRE